MVLCGALMNSSGCTPNPSPSSLFILCGTKSLQDQGSVPAHRAVPFLQSASGLAEEKWEEVPEDTAPLQGSTSCHLKDVLVPLLLKHHLSSGDVYVCIRV